MLQFLTGSKFLELFLEFAYHCMSCSETSEQRLLFIYKHLLVTSQILQTLRLETQFFLSRHSEELGF